MNKTWGIVAGIGVVVLLIVAWIAGTYNSLVTERENVRGSINALQSQYQRRADLVPNLVNTVKGAAN